MADIDDALDRAANDRSQRRVAAAPEVMRNLESFGQSIAAINTHDVFDRYRGQWVAAYDGKFIGGFPDLDAVLAELRARSIPLEQAVVEYVSPEHIKTVL